MKKILAIAMAFVLAMALSVCVFAADPLTLDNFGTSGWDSEYDAATKTITYSGAWTGRGWWIGEDAAMTGYESITIEFEGGAAAAGQVVCEYSDGSQADTTTFAAGDASVTAVIKPDSPCTQIYIQIGGDPKPLVLKAVSMAVAGSTPADTTPADTTPADTTPADTTPADTTPADTTPADTTPAPSTGLALAVVPAIIALGAVAVSKKH